MIYVLVSTSVTNLQNYFGDAWNVFDFVIVLGSFIDIVCSEVNVSILALDFDRVLEAIFAIIFNEQQVKSVRLFHH